MKKGSFDGIANKFDQNIYGTSKGKIRQLLLEHYLHNEIESTQPCKVLDAGGGTGMMAEVFARAGHSVDIMDVSQEALDIAKKRLAPYKNTQFFCQELSSVNKQYDLILCHAVLEWLENPMQAIEHLAQQLLPGGLLSLSFFNKDAMLFNNAIYGNFDYIEKGMKVRNVVRLNPHNPQSPSEVLEFIRSLKDVNLEFSAGIRCFHDYMRDVSMQNTHFDSILALEKSHGAQAPFKYLGKYFYIKVRRLTAS
ncbi:methyltransferase domain-containing protein [Glaciecola siphonariae]|uniref:tRNA 5-carboxymethoxyuridine methyltransferase n=1 Tax=Glaciecola siphonariae TaxID=521012 RepID=A0ABV9LRM7_9ALTE